MAHLRPSTPPHPISQWPGDQHTSQTFHSRRTLLAQSSPLARPLTASSSDTFGLPSPWKPRRRLPSSAPAFHGPLCSRACIRWLAVATCLTLATWFWRSITSHGFDQRIPQDWTNDAHIQEMVQPLEGSSDHKQHHSPEEWLHQHFDLKTQPAHHPALLASRPKAALISLVRNSELDGILQSMRELEFRFNRRHNYPWLFFSEKPFSSDFIAATSNITSGPTSYHLIPLAHWSTPTWIDRTRYMNSLDYLGALGVGKGWMLSYRNMCRWNSGFFYHHPALQQYDYYWRVEPAVHFFCDVPYDPFAFLHANDLVYGFNINILEDARSFPSLWSSTLDFISAHPNLIHPDADLEWLIDPTTGGDYNNCQFFSNFEIGSLTFFRSEPYQMYFNWLDERGGFYYERFGDAPVHTLALSLLVSKSKVWFFRDIGYQHDIARHCPAEGVRSGRCDCEPTDLDENFYKLVPMESAQGKPMDTCVRMWLGGEWLGKREGWSQDVERAVGGDGYGGYVKEG